MKTQDKNALYDMGNLIAMIDRLEPIESQMAVTTKVDKPNKDKKTMSPKIPYAHHRKSVPKENLLTSSTISIERATVVNSVVCMTPRTAKDTRQILLP